MGKNNNERYVVFYGKKYAFNLGKIKDFCLISDKETGKESEVLENYDCESGAMSLVSKTSRTLKGTGNPQNDSIVYDLMKLFITTLLTNEVVPFDDDDDNLLPLDAATALALNTMLEMEFIYEIK